MNVTGDVGSTLQAVSNASEFGMANIMLFCCFAFMVWQSWLQYKQKSRSEVEIDNLKQRMDKYDATITRLFAKLDELSANLNHISGTLDVRLQQSKAPL